MDSIKELSLKRRKFIKNRIQNIISAESKANKIYRRDE